MTGWVDPPRGDGGLRSFPKNDDILVIVFLGTENRLDWITNVEGGVGSRCRAAPRVHTGFFQAYWPIRDPPCLQPSSSLP